MIEILFILLLALIVIVVARAGVENADAPDEGMKGALRKSILLVLVFTLIFVPILRNPAFSGLPAGFSLFSLDLDIPAGGHRAEADCHGAWLILYNDVDLSWLHDLQS